MICPNISSFRGCENDIETDWLVMNPHTYEIYSINSVNQRQAFRNKFGMTFSFSILSAGQCLTSRVLSQNFSVTIINFNETLDELLVICGLKRTGSGVTDDIYSLISSGNSFFCEHDN